MVLPPMEIFNGGGKRSSGRKEAFVMKTQIFVKSIFFNVVAKILRSGHWIQDRDPHMD